jgi:hypothetical protein
VLPELHYFSQPDLSYEPLIPLLGSPISVPTALSLRRAQFAVGGVPGACFFQTPSLSALA